MLFLFSCLFLGRRENMEDDKKHKECDTCVWNNYIKAGKDFCMSPYCLKLKKKEK